MQEASSLKRFEIGKRLSLNYRTRQLDDCNFCSQRAKKGLRLIAALIALPSVFSLGCSKAPDPMYDQINVRTSFLARYEGSFLSEKSGEGASLDHEGRIRLLLKRPVGINTLGIPAQLRCGVLHFGVIDRVILLTSTTQKQAPKGATHLLEVNLAARVSLPEAIDASNAEKEKDCAKLDTAKEQIVSYYVTASDENAVSFLTSPAPTGQMPDASADSAKSSLTGSAIAVDDTPVVFKRVPKGS
jgi:hypothetical protein